MGDARITAVILAGGAGRRVGGRDKGWLEWQGRALVAHALALVAAQAGSVVISANRNLHRYRGLGVPVLADDGAPHAGPLAGIARAFGELTTPWLLTVPVDVPRFPGDLAARLFGAATVACAEVAVAHDGSHGQPVFALYAASVGARLRAEFAAGTRALWRFQGGCRMVQARFAPEDFFQPDLAALPTLAPDR